MKKRQPAGAPDLLPATLLILGTDLAGKDHVANVVTDDAETAGLKVERRRGAFSARSDRQRTSEEKGLPRLWAERAFLFTLPVHCRLIPYVAAFLIRRDLQRFTKPADTAVLVVSHTAVRLAAFALGHMYGRLEDIKMPSCLDKVLRAIVPVTRVRTIVLDIDHALREKRMAERMRRGTVDYFDRYMGSDPARSERIENFLVWIAMTYLGAVRIENNNLSDEEILASCSLLRQT